MDTFDYVVEGAGAAGYLPEPAAQNYPANNLILIKIETRSFRYS